MTFGPTIKRGPPLVKVNIYVKYNHCMSNRRGVVIQKKNHFSQTDRQTDSHGESRIHPQLRWRGYTNLFSMWRIRWKIIPMEVNVAWGVTFSRPLVQNLMLKFEPWQLLMLKMPGVIFYFEKWPRSHFSTGSLFYVTPVLDPPADLSGRSIKYSFWITF